MRTKSTLMVACDDDVLVARAKQGDEAAFAELWQRHSRRMYLVVRRILHQHEDAEDVLQDVVIKAWLHIGTFDGRSRFTTWLTSIAINSSLMSLRKTKRHQHVPLEPSPESKQSSEELFVDGRPSAEELLLVQERTAHLQRAIEELPLALRSALEQQLLGENCAKELAALFAITPAAMKSRLFRARKSFGRALKRADMPMQRTYLSW